MRKTVVIFFLFVFMIGLIPANALAQTTDGRYVQFGDTEIYTRVYNYKPKANEAVLFLHGLGGSHAHAEFLFHPDNPYMTITLDLLNHGQSGNSAEISWDILLGSIKAVIDGYGLKKVNLVGHSFGADMAMIFAQAYPKLVKEVVLIDRAYYNFSDLAQYGFTRQLVQLLEYNPMSGLTFYEFNQYLELAYSTDITQTWELKKTVLLVSADPSVYLTLPGFIAMLKMYPEQFGLTPELVSDLPDISEADAFELYTVKAGVKCRLIPMKSVG